MYKKFIGILVAVILVFSATSCSTSNTSGAGTEAEEIYTLKYGGITSQDHAVGQIVNHYFDLIEERSNGRIKVERFFDGSLGSAREVAESVKNGTIDFMWGGSGDLTVYAPVAEILTNTPYLYKTPEHGAKVLEEVWPKIDEMISKTGFKPLFPAYTGTRQIISKKPVRKFDDMKGLKKRTVETPFFMGIFTSMGANPTPISFNEVYTALQTDVVDAAGGDVLTIYTKKWHEQAKYLTLTDMILVQGIMTISEKTFNELPEDLQNMIVDTAWEVVPWSNNLTKDAEAETLEKLKAEGVEVIDLTDEELEPFRKSTKSFIVEYAEKLGTEVKDLYLKMSQIQ